MRRLLLGVSLLVPFAVFALDYSDHTESYLDAPFDQAESAGISLLTAEGAVQGYPDGRFRPGRNLNRAEFLKIAFMSNAEFLDGKEPPAHACFPDVHLTDWFHRYVCIAKEDGVVQGYPDGFFHPERPVLYVEAIKILVELYGYELPEPPANERWAWYRPYVLAAEGHEVLITGADIALDAELSRGQMARLAAAFLAESEGELDLYREMEDEGEVKSSSSSSKSLSSSSSSSLSSSSSSRSQSADLPDFPAKSHLLMLGERTEPIASASFFSNREPMLIRGVTVEMEAEYESIDSMYLIDAAGTQVGRLSLDVYDQTDKTWKASFATEGAYLLEKDTENVFGIEVLLKPRNGGGSSEELIQVDDFRLTVEGGWTHNTYESLPPDFLFPEHQTTQAEITSVENAGKETDAMPLGTDQVVGEFRFAGTAVPQADLRVTELQFEVSKPTQVTTTGWELGASDTNTRVSCSVSSSTVTCSGIPEELGSFENTSRTLRLFADVSLASGADNPFLQVSLNVPGSIGSNGAIRWTDGTGTFNWVELEQPIARGTRWE